LLSGTDFSQVPWQTHLAELTVILGSSYKFSFIQTVGDPLIHPGVRSFDLFVRFPWISSDFRELIFNFLSQYLLRRSFSAFWSFPVGKIAKKNSLKECHVVKNTLLQTVLSAIFPTGFSHRLSLC